MNLKYAKEILELDSKPTSYSISRLRTFTACSWKYKLKYIDKINRDVISDSLILGSLIHDALEQYFLDQQQQFVEHYLLSRLKLNLIDLRIISTSKQNSLTEINKLVETCTVYMHDYLSLYMRSSEWESLQPIRTKAGNVPKLAASTYNWKQSAKFFNLDLLESSIEQQLKVLNPALPADFSLPQAIGQAYGMAYSYIPPVEYDLDNIVCLEFPISHYDYQTKKLINPFQLPSEYRHPQAQANDAYITGYIDYVGYVNFAGKKQLAVIDYKSGKSDYTNDYLSFNPQLLFYALAYERITGDKVSVIGIHNLKSNNLALVKIEPKIQREVLTNFFYQQEIIEQQLFFKHLPESKYSPCLSSFNKKCPYLQDCHPNFIESS